MSSNIQYCIVFNFARHQDTFSALLTNDLRESFTDYRAIHSEYFSQRQAEAKEFKCGIQCLLIGISSYFFAAFQINAAKNFPTTHKSHTMFSNCQTLSRHMGNDATIFFLCTARIDEEIIISGRVMIRQSEEFRQSCRISATRCNASVKNNRKDLRNYVTRSR